MPSYPPTLVPHTLIPPYPHTLTSVCLIMWSQNGKTPVHIAAYNGSHQCIQALIVGKADVNIASKNVSGLG